MTKKKKEKEEFLENEIIEKSLSPHPLSFMKLQSLCLFLIIWGVILGWLVNFSEYKTLFSGNEWFILLAWGLVLLLVGVIASLIAIRWTIFFLYLSVFVSAIAIMVWQNWLNKDTAPIFIPFYSVAVSIIGFLIVEIHRRSHQYIITNLRIVLMSGFLTKTELSIRYDKITVFGKQSVLGQIFNFGTIIPITQSGLGLGSDQTLAAGGLMLGGKKAKLLGVAGGGKEVQTPRSRSSFELHGVHPYREIKNLIEKLVQESVPTAYHQEQVAFQKQQVDLQKQMRDLLKVQTKETSKKPARNVEINQETVEEEQLEEEPEPEQDDIQKQMKELIKKQSQSKEPEKVEDEIDEESEEEAEEEKS
jgi:hypothetical protein